MQLPDALASYYAGPGSRGYQYIQQQVPPVPFNSPPGMARVSSVVHAAIHAAPQAPPLLTTSLAKGTERISQDPAAAASRARSGRNQLGAGRGGRGAGVSAAPGVGGKDAGRGAGEGTGAGAGGGGDKDKSARSILTKLRQIRKSGELGAPVPGPGKYANDVRKMLDRVKGGVTKNPVNRYRSLRVQASE